MFNCGVGCPTGRVMPLHVSLAACRGELKFETFLPDVNHVDTSKVADMVSISRCASKASTIAQFDVPVSLVCCPLAARFSSYCFFSLLTVCAIPISLTAGFKCRRQRQ